MARTPLTGVRATCRTLRGYLLSSASSKDAEESAAVVAFVLEATLAPGVATMATATFVTATFVTATTAATAAAAATTAQ